MSNKLSKNEKKSIPRTIPSLLKFLLKEIIAKKKFHLLIAWFVLLIIGIFIIFINSTVILPAIYIGF